MDLGFGRRRSCHAPQPVFGLTFNGTVRGLRVGIVGCGGTGSPTAMLLARLGVGHLLLIDDDVVEASNLNRIHGARLSDADGGVPKVDALAREIDAAGLGVAVATFRGWVGDERARDTSRFTAPRAGRRGTKAPANQTSTGTGSSRNSKVRAAREATPVASSPWRDSTHSARRCSTGLRL